MPSSLSSNLILMFICHMLYNLIFLGILTFYIMYCNGDIWGWSYPIPRGYNMMKDYYNSGKIKLTHVNDMSYFFVTYLTTYVGLLLILGIYAISY